MGVLIGTSLVVIIPEGVDTLYSSVAPRTIAGSSSEAAVANAMPAHQARDSYVPSGAKKEEDGGFLRRAFPLSNFTPGQGATEDAVEKRMDHKRPQTTSLGTAPSIKEDARRQPPPNEKETENSSPHAWTGIALISGFVFMYLIDKTAQYTSFASHKPRPHHISLDNLASALGRLSSNSGSSGGLPTSSNQSSLSASTSAFSSFTLGLVIHAVSDGIALGASSTSPSLSLIIFFALLIHKAPAAFGLSTILLQHTNLSHRAVRTHLAIFSLASPVGAVMTWLVAHTLLASHHADESSTNFRTGVLLLFSAGTFLYVAVHAMHEHDRGSTPTAASGSSAGPTSLLSGGSRRNSFQMNDFGDSVMTSSSPSAAGKPRVRNWVASVIGMLLPLFLQIGHAH